MEFLFNARNLQIYSIKKAVGFPKRYTFYVSQPIANSAVRIFEFVKKGNSIYPTNQHEAQLRRDFFLNAHAELQSLISQIEVAQEIFGIEASVMQTWMEMIEKELRLVKAVMKKDRARYQELP